MKKENFLARMTSVVAEAVKFIEKETKKKKIVLFVGEPEGDEDEFYDLPTITQVSKHGYYEQFAILSVEQKKGKILLNTKGRGENDSKETFILSELSADDNASVCFLADIISKKLK